MFPESFEILLKLVEPDIIKTTTKMREPIGRDQRLAVTLQYLTTGNAHSTIGANYRISNSIWNRLKEAGYVKTPSSTRTSRKSANEFEVWWNFTNALRAIDVKHVLMFAPARQSSTFFNYKKKNTKRCAFGCL